MRHTPRGWNRTLIFLTGLVLLAAGALSVALGVLPELREQWKADGKDALSWVKEQFDASRVDLFGVNASWIWLALLVLGIVVLWLMIAWIAAQSTPRAHAVQQARRDGEAISVGTDVVSELLKDAAASNRRYVGVHVSAWPALGHAAKRARKRFRHGKAAVVNANVLVKVHAKKGGSPAELAASSDRYIQALDTVVGVSPLTLVEIKAGARSALAGDYRVE